MATTGVCDSFKVELLQGGHCFNPAVTPTATAASGSTSITGVSALTNVSTGMNVTGTGIATGSVVAAITASNAFTISPATTAAISGGALTITGDTFKLALVKASPVRTFDHTQTNIGTPSSGASSATSLGTDEIGASGSYSSGGATLTMATPSLPGNPSTTAATGFSAVSFTSATISTTAGIVYNNSTRQGASAAPLGGRTVEVLDFGGTQSVVAGTLTITPPVLDGTTGLLRIS